MSRALHVTADAGYLRFFGLALGEKIQGVEGVERRETDDDETDASREQGGVHVEKPRRGESPTTAWQIHADSVGRPDGS